MSCFKYLYDACWKCKPLQLREALCYLYAYLLFLSGPAAVFFSIIWLYRSFYHYLFLPEVLYGPFFLLLLLGIVNPFIAWLGIGGCRREHDFHIILFMILLIVIAFVDLTIGIWTMVIWSDADIETAGLISKALSEAIGEHEHFRDWDRLHSHLECCGANGRTDFSPDPPPNSCCEGAAEGKCASVFEIGCLVPLQRYCQKLLFTCAVVYFLWAVFKILGLATVILYYRAMRIARRERRKRLMELEKEEHIQRELAARELATQHGDRINTNTTETIVLRTLQPNGSTPSPKRQAPSAPSSSQSLPAYRSDDEIHTDSLKADSADENDSNITEKDISKGKLDEEEIKAESERLLKPGSSSK